VPHRKMCYGLSHQTQLSVSRPPRERGGSAGMTAAVAGEGNDGGTIQDGRVRVAKRLGARLRCTRRGRYLFGAHGHKVHPTAEELHSAGGGRAGWGGGISVATV